MYLYKCSCVSESFPEPKSNQKVVLAHSFRPRKGPCGHDVRVQLFLCIHIINLDRKVRYSSCAAYNVHVLLTTPTEFTNSRKYAETS